VLHEEGGGGWRERKREVRPIFANSPLRSGTARQRVDVFAARHTQDAMQAFRAPIETGLPPELALDAGADQPNAKAGRCRRARGRATALAPVHGQALWLELPPQPPPSSRH